MKFSIDVTGERELIASFDKIEKGITDFRKEAVWVRVRQEFNRIEKEHFGAEGNGKSGKWASLSSPYREIKAKKWGTPILQRTKRLYKSLTQKTGDSVVEEKDLELTLGTSVPYGGYHQKGTKKMPARPPIDMTEEQAKRLVEPIKKHLRQLAQNARLAGK